MSTPNHHFGALGATASGIKVSSGGREGILFDHLVGDGEQRRWHLDAEHPGHCGSEQPASGNVSRRDRVAVVSHGRETNALIKRHADLQLRLALLRIGEVAEFAVSRPGGAVTVRAAMAEREPAARSK
jgi:hypothetical protein